MPFYGFVKVSGTSSFVITDVEVAEFGRLMTVQTQVDVKKTIKSQSKSTFNSYVSGISASTGVLCCVDFIDVYAVRIC